MRRVRRIAVNTALAATLVLAVIAGPLSAAVGAPDAHAAAASRRVVVGLERGNTAKGLASAKAKGGGVERLGPKGRFAVVKVPAAMSAEEFSATLQGQAGIDYAQPQQVVQALMVPNDPYFPEQWGMSAVNAPAAWDVERGDPSVVIAIIDTGVDLANPDLSPHVDTVNDWDFVNWDEVAQDDSGHGTHVAGIAAAIADNGLGVAGVANGATILPLKVLDNVGKGTDTDLAWGIYEAADRGADVINISAGLTSESPAVTDALNYALGMDCVVVAASGNNNSQVVYPAANAGVIAVGATDAGGARVSISNYGPKLDMVAPGDGIVSNTIGGGVAAYRGTSMAAPHVSGAAALLRSRFTFWTHEDIEGRLQASARDLGVAGRDDLFGSGLLNLQAALGGSATTASADDVFPGVLLTAAQRHGTLDVSADTDDIYAVSLLEGQSLTATVVEDAGVDCELRVFGPGTTSLQSPPLAANSWGLTYTAPVGGQYYLDAHVVSGAGGYSLQLSKSMVPTSVSLSGRTQCNWGEPVELYGKLTRAGGRTALGGQSVFVEQKPAGALGWAPMATTTTGQFGEYAVLVYPTRTTQYRTRFQSTGELSGAEAYWAVQPKAALSRPSAPSRVVHGVAFTSYGSLAPRDPGGTRTVKITAYRWENRRWVMKRYVYATNVSKAQYSAYSARVSLPRAGSWKLVSSVVANSRHAATRSASRYVWVK